MADEAAPGAGTIPITLTGEELKLTPSLEACIAISNMAGGLTQAVARCHQMNFDTICEVICLGLGATSGPQRKQVKERVYETGLINVAADAILFIRVVANGGQVPKEEGDGTGDRPLDLQSASETTTSSS